jgi:2-keto-4-pentenoate hydratase
MPTIDPPVLARELAEARALRQIVPTLPSGRDPGLDLATAYAVEAELVRLRQAAGRSTVGLKVGFANKAMWRVLKLETLVWAHMYDDTVHHADGNSAVLDLSGFHSPKIEPEIVLKVRRRLADGEVDAAAVLDAIEWIALGFEIIDCPFAEWKFQPADFVASFGLHAALIVGAPQPIQHETVPELVEQLASFTLALQKDGQTVATGAGRNALRSPALCVGELAAALSRHAGARPLEAGSLVSSGTLTEGQSIGPAQVWTAQVEGLGLPDLTVRTGEN